MNEDLAASARFKNISNIITTLFIALTLILVPVLAFVFNNYWLLFGIAFSYIGFSVREFNLKSFFVIVTIAIGIYWFNSGFHFSESFTFFWFCSLFGVVFKSVTHMFDELARRIIEMKASEMTSELISGIKSRQEIVHEK